MPCARGTLLGPIYDRRVMAYARNDCKRLRCPHCGQRKAKRYHRRVSQLALEHKLQRFITLTLDPAKSGQREEGQPINTASVDHIRQTWAKMRVYLGRRYPHVKFIAVLEFQMKSTGNAHLHVLVDTWIDKDWLRRSWESVGGGITWIEFADVHRIPQYLGKYMTKDLMGKCPGKKRVITTSRDLRLTDPPRNLDWSYRRTSITWYFPFDPTAPESTVVDWQIDDLGLLYFETELPATPF